MKLQRFDEEERLMRYYERAFSRLFADRIIFLFGDITSPWSDYIVAQMLCLEAEDPDKDIQLYINSRGGEVSAALAIYDTMQTIKCEVRTTCVGLAASAAALILAGGAKGKRFSLPNAKILIHQPLGMTGGQAVDIKIHADDIMRTRDRINEILAKHTGQPKARIEKDTDRDFIMTAEEAKSYGLIDQIIYARRAP